MSKPLRVGLVGYGMAGRHIHRPLLECAGFDVVGVLTTSANRGAAARADFPEAQVLPDVAGIIALRPDVVVVASPTPAHPDNALAAIEAGIPVVVDKPLAADADRARAVVVAAERAGVPLTVFHNRRHDANQRTLRALLEQGRLGEVIRIERRYERWRPVPKPGWRTQDSAADGGGLLLDLGAHIIDSAVQVLGPVTQVYAELRAHTTVAEDDVFLACRHAGGAVSHLDAHSLAGAAGPLLRVLGTEAAYVGGKLDEEPSSPLTPEDAEGCTGWLVQGERREPVRTAPGEQADFYRAVAAWLTEGGPVPVDPWEAVHTAQVMDAARVSAAENRVVAL